MRLQKYMAEAGIGSRRKCEEYISQGLVKVNGVVASIGMSVEEGDTVEYAGRVISPDSERVIIIFNKPAGVMCTSSDPEGRATVQDYFKNYPHRLYNVGRLDYDSEGLIIMTNDGELAYKMMHPKFSMEKTYYAICSGTVTEAEAEKLRRGVDIGDERPTAPAEVREVRTLTRERTGLFITIHEGRNRQIRRMLEALGHETESLRRLKVGPLYLGELKSGEWRLITDAEKQALDELMI